MPDFLDFLFLGSLLLLVLAVGASIYSPQAREHFGAKDGRGEALARLSNRRSGSAGLYGQSFSRAHSIASRELEEIYRKG